MARTAEDCALLLQTMAGFDQRDSTSLQQDIPDYEAALTQDLAGLRIGLPQEYFAEGLNSDVARAIEAAVEQYSRLGATVRDIHLPNSKIAIKLSSQAASLVIAKCAARSCCRTGSARRSE